MNWIFISSTYDDEMWKYLFFFCIFTFHLSSARRVWAWGSKVLFCQRMIFLCHQPYFENVYSQQAFRWLRYEYSWPKCCWRRYHFKRKLIKDFLSLFFFANQKNFLLLFNYNFSFFYFFFCQKKEKTHNYNYSWLYTLGFFISITMSKHDEHYIES